MLKKVTMVMVFTLSMPMLAQAAGDAAAGKAKSMVCAACHGGNGISAVPSYPNLKGQKAAYLESSLQAFRAKTRTGNQAAMMYGMAATLSDADIANLAAYYSAL
ncbi:MAG: cytochrome c [Bermanella sp.]